MKLLVTRPEPDGERTAEALRARGHEVLLAPMLRMQAVDFTVAAERYEDESLRRLVGLCAELQRRAGNGEPFYLACRAAGAQLSIDHKLANKWLRLLVRDRVLVEVEKGKRRRATTFRYVGELNESVAAA